LGPPGPRKPENQREQAGPTWETNEIENYQGSKGDTPYFGVDWNHLKFDDSAFRNDLQHYLRGACLRIQFRAAESVSGVGAKGEVLAARDTA
jgi:hypothetical protein